MLEACSPALRTSPLLRLLPTSTCSKFVAVAIELARVLVRPTLREIHLITDSTASKSGLY